jgi:hypothetical protein
MPYAAVTRAKTNQYISKVGREIILVPLKNSFICMLVHTHLEKIYFNCIL